MVDCKKLIFSFQILYIAIFSNIALSSEAEDMIKFAFGGRAEEKRSAEARFYASEGQQAQFTNLLIEAIELSYAYNNFDSLNSDFKFDLGEVSIDKSSSSNESDIIMEKYSGLDSYDPHIKISLSKVPHYFVYKFVFSKNGFQIEEAASKIKKTRKSYTGLCVPAEYSIEYIYSNTRSYPAKYNVFAWNYLTGKMRGLIPLIASDENFGKLERLISILKNQEDLDS